MTNPICSACKVKLMQTDTQNEFVCPKCGRSYMPDFEIVEYPDEVVPVGSEDMPELLGIGGGAGIMAATDEQDGSLTDQLYKSPKTKPNQGEGAERWD
jgi:hypothetical protein